jgi:phospholipid-translocating ATPase
MVFAAVFAANLYNGLNTSAWTGWVFFAVFIGTILVWAYTVSLEQDQFYQTFSYLCFQAVYDSISPSWFVTPIWGNNHYLFESAYFWLCLPLTILLALLPRYIYKAYKANFSPDDIDILRYLYKTDPHRDLAHDPNLRGHLTSFKRHRTVSLGSRSQSRMASAASLSRPSMDFRSASRTDMSTGVRSIHRGFDFSTEENGVAMRRMQSNLSERRQSSRNLATQTEPTTLRTRRGTLGHVFSVPKSFRRKKGPKAKELEH